MIFSRQTNPFDDLVIMGIWVSGRRQTSVLKLALVVLHVIFVGVLFLFDRGLREKTLREPW